MLRLDADRYRTLDRRSLVRGFGASAIALTGGVAWTRRTWAQPIFRYYPFSLGIASGDPVADGVVLWTRVAPEPLAGGGMPNQAVEVGWQVGEATKSGSLEKVVQQGTAIAHPELGHAVHVEVGGLQPDREYFYRFTVGKERSPIGRTRTTPVAGAPAMSLRLGIAGCQRYEDGHFTAFRHLADERLDLVFHYGDYIYEYRGRDSAEILTRPTPRTFDQDEIYTLVDYRNRYAVYKMDHDLQAAHASAPFVSSFDDHEVDNNWAASLDQDGTPPEVFALRRAAAFQAWYENMPVRRSSWPQGSAIQVYRQVPWGDLVALNVLDTRQYRTDQPCGDTMGPRCEGMNDPSATILGAEQTTWLEQRLAAPLRWNVLAQQVMVAQLDRSGDPAAPMIGPDKWDGYLASRNRLFDRVGEQGTPGFVVLTGDIHNNWAAELKRDFDGPGGRVLGAEFTATSITSGGDGADRTAETERVLAANPHIKFFNNQRGYCACTVTPGTWRTDYRVVDKVTVPGAAVTTRASFVSEHGRPGVVGA